MKKLIRLRKRALVFRAMNRLLVRRSIGVAFVLFLMLCGGFMGVRSFNPAERIIEIGNPLASSGITYGVEDSGNKNAGGLVVDGKGAVLMDAGSGVVLFSQKGDDRLPPASVTKVMTMLLVMEAVDRGQAKLTDTVTVSARAASMGGSQMYMEEGEQHSLGELMEGIAMVSANDACIAAAEHIGGNVEIFVESMNRRAVELGMKNSCFANTNGLPVSNHYSSAYDIALMSRELVRHEKVKDWFNTWQSTVTVGLPGKQKEFGLTNTNRLIKIYPGADGIKTGFTKDAGYCLSGSATRDGMTLIAVILGSSSSKVRFAEISKMLDYGFATYDSVTIAKGGEPSEAVAIEKGDPAKINAIVDEDISILVKKGEAGTVKVKSSLRENICAPVEKGEQLGELIILQNDEEIAKYPLIADEGVKRASWPQLYIRMMKNLI